MSTALRRKVPCTQQLPRPMALISSTIASPETPACNGAVSTPVSTITATYCLAYSMRRKKGKVKNSLLLSQSRSASLTPGKLTLAAV